MLCHPSTNQHLLSSTTVGPWPKPEVSVGTAASNFDVSGRKRERPRKLKFVAGEKKKKKEKGKRVRGQKQKMKEKKSCQKSESFFFSPFFSSSASSSSFFVLEGLF